VHASEREGLPRSAVQAIAGGKPLVVAALPGIEELIEDGVNGLIARSDDLADLAAKLFSLLDSPSELARLQHGARSTDVSSWQEELMSKRIDGAYAAALAAKGRSEHPITTIEFLGLPGSGKTTIAGKLLGLVREDRASVRFSRDDMGADLSFVPRSLRRLGLVTRAFCRSPRRMYLASRGLTPEHRYGKDALKTLWNYCSVLAMQSRPGEQLLVADEGLAQAIWTARMHHGADAAPARPIFDQAQDWIEKTLFIHVDAPAAVARQRLAKRPRHTSRFQDANRINDLALWDRGTATMNRIVEEIDGELARRGLYGRVLRIASDRADTPLDRAKIIRTCLQRLERRSANRSEAMAQATTAEAAVGAATPADQSAERDLILGDQPTVEG
jgi:predicted kinase